MRPYGPCRTRPAAAEPLDEAGCAELREFLVDLAAHGRSAVLITSRTPEDWLGEVRRITVGGLAAHEAAEYAGDPAGALPGGGAAAGSGGRSGN